MEKKWPIFWKSKIKRNICLERSQADKEGTDSLTLTPAECVCWGLGDGGTACGKVLSVCLTVLGAPGRGVWVPRNAGNQAGKEVREEDGRPNHASAHSPASRANTSCPLPQAPHWPQAQSALLHSQRWSLVLQVPQEPWLQVARLSPGPRPLVSYFRRNEDSHDLGEFQNRSSSTLGQPLWAQHPLHSHSGAWARYLGQVLLRMIIIRLSTQPTIRCCFLSYRSGN